ncbi:Uncharacterized conserved protein YlxW, UPF0749 family [Streptomyces sp. 2224.1]|uniref:DUF881 domain-containing protein n=1 Tax=unclassified Streptomyces TaxID=2593676 RepID=UPI00087E76FF|nr:MULTISPECIES: DUF881 domain-containing protein [unclassified Streptomyces]PBC80964.1 uncharacterized protein YlxW (UPF0749 family) [Streptomyces sp. 2321.6]SDR56833.1 Uncharacterized conserved protein YlxW, UPF0749 family [Streptomyces sp. KS_16]SEB95685.1 Uncharacterized conserved protein YlxW, UPF0749 family [Streptomyces sp. 2133.1]SED31195.1 Uncharacterized conserved protein YlxW, UPF0749 family [Streptomyces sp. 2224.1]SNC63033.1 Uncharacterized conserved protein YlxW, UPF0749 family [
MSTDEIPEPEKKPEQSARADQVEQPEPEKTPEPEKQPEPEKKTEPEKQPEREQDSGPAGRWPMPPESRITPERAEAEEDTEAPEPDSAGHKADKGADSSTPEAVADNGSAQRPKSGRERLVASLWPPRLTRAQLIVALLLFILGLGLAIQVRSTSDSSALRGARQEDLVRILDELDNRSQRLTDEQRRLEGQKTELANSSDQAEEARKQTVEKEQQLGVLAGTVAAQGPGITLTIDDPTHSVEADKLLDTIQELRAAGAEAIQVNDVRVVANTSLSDLRGGVEIDGKRVAQPYRFKVIGKPQDLEPALNIPGGVVQTLEKEQAKVSVTREEKIIVDALREAKRPDYARSSSQ